MDIQDVTLFYCNYQNQRGVEVRVLGSIANHDRLYFNCKLCTHFCGVTDDDVKSGEVVGVVVGEIMDEVNDALLQTPFSRNKSKLLVKLVKLPAFGGVLLLVLMIKM